MMRRAASSPSARWLLPLVMLAAVAGLTSAAGANDALEPIGDLNPLRILEDAGESVPGYEGGLSSTLNIVLLLTVLSLAPSVLIMCTCFVRVMVVLGLLRQALGTQGLPPGQVLVGLTLFITIVVMAPTGQRMWVEGIEPYMSGEVQNHEVAWQRTRQPLRDFMFAQIEHTGNWSSLYMMLNYRGVDTSEPENITRADVDMISLVPAFILSELRTAFLIGFQIYLPFLVIDMVIASLLISMGMLMLPPVLISLPFKLLLFVLVDGWRLVVGSTMRSIVQTDNMAASAGWFEIGRDVLHGTGLA